MKIDINEAGSHLSLLGKLAWHGEPVIITQNEQPYLRLLPHRTDRRLRKPGLLKGKIVMSSDFMTIDPSLPNEFGIK